MPSDLVDPVTGRPRRNAGFGNNTVDLLPPPPGPPGPDGIPDSPPPGTAGALTALPNPSAWSVLPGRNNTLTGAEALMPTSAFGRQFFASPGASFAGTYLNDVQVDFLVKATQADRRAVSLTAPRLTLTNGQQSWIAITKNTPYVSDVEPIVQQQAVAFDPVIGFAPEGVSLNLQATVSADRRYVTLNVNVGTQTIDGFATFTTSGGAAAGGGAGGGGGGGGSPSVSVTATFDIPITTNQQVRTTATVPDQGTLLLGGQRKVSEVEVEVGVPVLSKIPIINRFFTNRVTSKTESTLMILIRPQIIIQNEEEEKNFPGLLESLKTGLGG
jgi:general secretion pathway protein D